MLKQLSDRIYVYPGRNVSNVESKPNGSRQAVKKRWLIAAIALTLVFAVTLAAIIYKFIPFNDFDSDKYKTSSVSASSSAVSSYQYVSNPIDFDALLEKNPDVCAWITVPNTAIDYPILQSSDADDNYYLKHNFDKQYTQDGAIFIQRLNSFNFTDPNTVVYGHNLLNGTMFRTLHYFRDKEFFDANEYFYIYTPGHILTYRIFSAYRSDNRHILNSYDFTDREIFEQYLETATNPQSMIRNVREGVEVTADDRIVTLSTCISDKRYRYLVQGVLIKDELTY